MQDKTGGYCPRCDTVWASPGKCRCEPIEDNRMDSEDWTNGWNAAIEAAALELVKPFIYNGKPYADLIRKLKK